MSDRGNWWAEPGSQEPHESMPDPWDMPDPRAPGAPLPPRFGRLLAGVVAGAIALAVALIGGGAAIDHQQQPFAVGALLGGSHPAADTSAATSGKAAPQSKSKSTFKPKSVAPQPSAAPAPVLPVAEVVDRVKPGVVIINSQLSYQNAEAAGTGMVLTGAGEILTNNHVIDGATQVTVIIPATQQRYTARVVGTAPASDVAVLALEGASGLATIPVASSDAVTAGQPVVAIGNAGGLGILSVVTGAVTSTDRTITASDASGRSSERLTGMIEVQAAIRPGDSGGPLVNRAGQVIGMDTAASASRGAQRTPTYGFAIPINRALAVAGQLKAADKGAATPTGRGFLGIQVRTADSAHNTGGAEVILTTPGSPASAAGLAAGDVITQLNGAPVISATGLTQRLQLTRPGQSVTVGWIDRFGESHSVRVTLANGPAD